MTLNLEEIRQDIDLIDRQIFDLLSQRFDLSQAVAAYKIQVGQAIFDPVREEEKLKALAEDYQLPQVLIQPFTQLMAHIMNLSKDQQQALIGNQSKQHHDYSHHPEAKLLAEWLAEDSIVKAEGIKLKQDLATDTKDLEAVYQQVGHSYQLGLIPLTPATYQDLLTHHLRVVGSLEQVDDQSPALLVTSLKDALPTLDTNHIIFEIQLYLGKNELYPICQHLADLDIPMLDLAVLQRNRKLSTLVFNLEIPFSDPRLSIFFSRIDSQSHPWSYLGSY